MDKMEWYDDSHILTIYESQLRDDSPIYEMEHKSHVWNHQPDSNHH